MIRNLCKDDAFLSLKAEKATELDKDVGKDLMDTLMSHASTCVGMAANMIGVNKAIIAILDDKDYVLMYNPEIIKSNKTYSVEEGCLCHKGKKLTLRYETIKVSYQDKDFKTRIKSYSGFSAEIIQHEIDHLNGILI